MKKHILIITGLVLLILLPALFIGKFFPDAMLFRDPTPEEKQEAFIRKHGKPLSVTLELGILPNVKEWPGGPEIKLTEEQTRRAEQILKDAIEKADRIEVRYIHWSSKMPDGTGRNSYYNIFDVKNPALQKALADSFSLHGNTRIPSPFVYGDPPPMKLTLYPSEIVFGFYYPEKEGGGLDIRSKSFDQCFESGVSAEFVKICLSDPAFDLQRALGDPAIAVREEEW